MQAHGGEPIIPFSGKFESTLFDMPDDEKAAHCKEVRAQFFLLLSPVACTTGPNRWPLAAGQPVQPASCISGSRTMQQQRVTCCSKNGSLMQREAVA